MDAVTPSQLHVMQHGIGWDRTPPRSRRNLRQGAEPWRNRFCAEEGHHDWADLQRLVAMDLMALRLPGVFEVTKQGIGCVLDYSEGGK